MGLDSCYSAIPHSLTFHREEQIFESTPTALGHSIGTTFRSASSKRGRAKHSNPFNRRANSLSCSVVFRSPREKSHTCGSSSQATCSEALWLSEWETGGYRKARGVGGNTVEGAYTVAFLRALATDLENRLRNEWEVKRGFNVSTGGRGSQGFSYDIGIRSRDWQKLVLIEIEIGGKTPIYNLMKTVYWCTLSRDRPPHIMFLHVFSAPEGSKSQYVPQDLARFAERTLSESMFAYEQINFPELGELRLVATTEYLTRTGKLTDELEQRLKETATALFSERGRKSAKFEEELRKAAEEPVQHKKDSREIRLEVIERVIDEIVPRLSDRIVEKVTKGRIP